MRICVQRERERSRERERRGREGGRERKTLCVCVHRETPQLEGILGWGRISGAAMKNEHFQVHIPTHIFLYLRNVQPRKRLCVCVSVCVRASVFVCEYERHAYLRLRNSSLQTTISCHAINTLKILSSSLYPPVCFHGSKPEYNDEP